MESRPGFNIGIAMALVLVVVACSYARPPKPVRFKHADKNKDGRIGPRELAAEKKHKAKVNTPWEARADTNNDGKVSPGELRKYRLGRMDANKNGVVDIAERRVYWVAWRAKVNTPFERLHDTNGDGFIDGAEAQEMLRDRLRIINTQGKAKVNTPLEREFDANKDGVIDREEAQAIRDAVGG